MSTDSASKKLAKWQANGAKYMRKYGGLRPGQLVQIDPKLNAKVKTLMGAMCPAVAASIDKNLSPVHQRAETNWPVASGLSKSLLALEYTVQGDTFKASLKNRAPYAYFIRHKTTVKGLIFEPGHAAAKKIGADIGTEYVRRIK